MNGTSVSSSAHSSGTLCDTDTEAVYTRQSPGTAVGEVTCAVVTLSSLPVLGVNDPVKPASVQVSRACRTVMPTRSGTSRSVPMQPAGTGSGGTGIPLISPPKIMNVLVAVIVSGSPTML